MSIDRVQYPRVGQILAEVASVNPQASIVLEDLYERVLTTPDLPGLSTPRTDNRWVTPEALEGIADAAKLVSGLEIIKTQHNKLSVCGPGKASIEAHLPLYIQSAPKTATLYSNHVLASDSGHIRSIPQTGITFHKMREGETKTWAAFPTPIRTYTDPDCWVGNSNNIVVFSKPSQCRQPRSSMPDFVTNLLKPAPLLPKDNPELNARFAQKIQEWSFIPKLGIKQDKLLSVLNNCGINFSRTLMTPMAFVDVGHEGWTSFYDTAHLATTKVSAIEIQKLRNNFELTEITLAQYLENPQKYFVVLDIPKIITFISKHYIGDTTRNISGVGVAMQFVALLPTLIIHPAMLTTGSETVAENLYLLLENLNKANLSNLIHRESYYQALDTLKETTTHWDGVLQVLAGADPTDIRTALDELDKPDNANAEAFRKGNAGISKVYCSKEFTKWTETRNQTAKQAEQVAQLTVSLGSTQKQHKAQTNHITNLKQQLAMAESDLVRLDTTGSTIRQNLDTAKTSIVLAEAKSKEIYEQIGALADHVDFERFSKEVYIKSIGISENRGMQHEITLARRPGYPNVFCVTENKAAAAREHCADKTFGDLVTILQAHHPDTPEFIKALIRLLGLSQIKLTYVNLFTTSPVKIYVDWASKPKEQCNVVVGGPYTITVSDGSKMSGKLYLSSPDGIFGIKAVGHDYADLKQHPHSKEMKINRKDPKQFVQFIKTPTVMCFGEAEAVLKKAFADKNLEEIRNVVYQWATSAWSRDQWGANWSWFPTPDRVSIDGTFNAKAT